ncbi:MAG: hypothetical protein FJY07_08975 [Bacteroidetes bacterium]|nr:hypothetical protein [Bacteroidota bacterium]
MNEKIFNKLSEKYDSLFIENIETFRKAANPAGEYSVFYPSFGIRRENKCDFLILGQATNGWSPNFRTSDEVISADLCQKSYEYSNCYCKEREHNPLDWVNVFWSKSTYQNEISNNTCNEFYEKSDYFTFHSFFWNVVYKTICDHYKFKDRRNSWEWTKKMVWSNLYKIAPSNGYNPNDIEKEWQRKLSLGLIKQEIDELKPRFCIVLTNLSWWEPFQKILEPTIINKSETDEIHSVQWYKNTKIIVTKRPARGNHDNYATEILKKLNNCQSEVTYPVTYSF